MQLFYNPNITENTKEILFTKEESRHIVRVLRKKEEDLLKITNGKNYLFTAKIIIANDKKCVAIIVETEYKKKSWNYNLHIAIAPTKNIDRLEWFIEKATEIGIDEITPIICQNSERKIVKHDRLEKIMLSAMKQSLKYNAPILHPTTKFSDFINSHKNTNSIHIAHCRESDKTSLKELNDLPSKVTILIGPEGDFSEKEVSEALKTGATPISLGTSRLRTETAALVAVHSINFIKN